MNAESLYEFFLWASLVSTVSLLLCLGISFGFAYFKMDKLFEYLKNSHAVTGQIYCSDSRAVEMLAMVNRVIHVVAKSRHYLHKGTANPKDIKNFPSGLKFLFIVLYWVRVGSFWLWLIAFVALHLSWFAPSQQPGCYCQINQKTGEIDYEIVR